MTVGINWKKKNVSSIFLWWCLTIAIKPLSTFPFLVVIKNFRNGITQEILIESNQALYQNQITPSEKYLRIKDQTFTSRKKIGCYSCQQVKILLVKKNRKFELLQNPEYKTLARKLKKLTVNQNADMLMAHNPLRVVVNKGRFKCLQ